MPLLRSGLRAGRILVAVALLVPVLAVLGLVATARLFVWPPTDPVDRADAVVVLAGGHGERLERGLELVRDGVAPTLVLSFGPPGLCDGSGEPFDVVCFTPSPETTRGEAEAIGALAREHGWSEIVVVTSTPHVTRARMLVDRCFDGTLQATGATPNTDLAGWFVEIVHEWGGLVNAMVQRSC